MSNDPQNPDLDDTRFAEETDPGNPGKRDGASEEDLVEEFEKESFPASDPPANY
ncbi:hypothetical protein [Corynebacterium nasicanis]|uniref:Uncharacterized protein n=1 Tax=Corynebacterium nasicanis TaxID=1448267 RepID=A0ABW1QAD2_9CORY